MATLPEFPNFDKLWNYNDPAETELKFREILAETEDSQDYEYIAQLLTQIARCEGLQGKFTQAHVTLDNAHKLIQANDLRLAHIRYLLERGRAFNSNGKPETAKPLFQKAYELGVAQNEMRYAIDAIHMIAIVEPDPQNQIKWNLKGIELVEANTDQKGWLFALLNNIGESYLSIKEYELALNSFQRLSELQLQKNGEADRYTLKDIAKCLRLLGEQDQALQILQPILNKLLSEGKDDGFIRQEFAESTLAVGRTDESKIHFAKAYELLSQDDWIRKNEPNMLDRLNKLSL